MTAGRRDAWSVARAFWDDAGGGDSFPRDIEPAVARTLPLTIVRLPALDAAAVAGRLLRWGIGVAVPLDDDRPFMGCLVARGGNGIIFVHGGDDPAEQRLTIAHETAHFLLDYLFPRQDVLDALGESAADVLDGLRVPTHAERAAAVLRHVRLGPHVHLLARDEAASAAVGHAETRADELAVELLAPRHDLLPRLTTADVADLASRYGVPGHVFKRRMRQANRERPVSFLGQAIAAAREAR